VKTKRYYSYPFGPHATGPNRIDQGVDLGGSGPIFAIGRARILKTESPWPEYGEGKGILYQLLEGPYKGRVVYVYEGVKASVRKGQVVKAGQQIGTIIPGTSTGIEIGWANPKTGQPTSHGEYSVDGLETRAGKAFGGFLALLKPVKASEYGKPARPGKGKIPSFAEESGNSGIPGLEKYEQYVEGPLETGGIGGLAGEIINGIFGDLAKSAEPFMLNIALILGGAILVYLGVAKLLGVNRPLGAPTRAATAAAGLA
jgi:hypothetical protein